MSVPTEKLSQYRPDIDGLRAVAVLSVVIYHAFPEAFAGGFLGVDIFFVISGYLISGIIFRSIDNQSFSLKEFYGKRVRRIFPSLCLVLIFSYVLGWFVLFRKEFKELSLHVLAGAGFSSNFLLWFEAGYFDAAAEVKPLLHLWSLGIEEQFYLFFPLIFIMVQRLHYNRLAVLSVCFILSFAINLALYESHQTAAFYFCLARFWELMIGSFLAIALNHKKDITLPWGYFGAEIWAIGGAALIMLGFTSVHTKTPFPGYAALLPTLGTSLIIAAGMSSQFNRIILGNKIFTWFGRISYPLYLWHWPLLVFSRIIKAKIPSSDFRLGIVCVSILFAWGTYRYIEFPLRFGGHHRRKVIGLSLLTAGLGLLGYMTYQLNGIALRDMNQFGADLLEWDSLTREHVSQGCGIANEEASKKVRNCIHDSRQTPTMALIGDSKADFLSYGLFSQSTPESRFVFIGGSNEHTAPVTLITDHPLFAKYQSMIRFAIDAVKSNDQIKVVALYSATRALFQLETEEHIEDLPHTTLSQIVTEGLAQVVKELVGVQKKVVLIIDNPTLPAPYDCIFRTQGMPFINSLFQVKPKKCTIAYDRHLELSKPYRDALQAVAYMFPHRVRIYDPLPLLCDIKNNICRSQENGTPLYLISDHISRAAADKIGGELVPFMRSFADSP